MGQDAVFSAACSMDSSCINLQCSIAVCGNSRLGWGKMLTNCRLQHGWQLQCSIAVCSNSRLGLDRSCNTALQCAAIAGLDGASP